MFSDFFPNTHPNSEILDELEKCQDVIHEWGHSHQVSFDASKEHFAVLSRTCPTGSPFKLLGALIDVKLIMDAEICRVRSKAMAKTKAILRTRRFYSMGQMVQQYKSHVLCILEGTTGAIFHASRSHLAKLDDVQEKFCKFLGLSACDAFLKFNLAPLATRRNIAMLGLLHRIQNYKTHVDFRALFPSGVAHHSSRSTNFERAHETDCRQVRWFSL